MKKLLALLILFSSTIPFLQGQKSDGSQPFVLGRIDQLKSSVLNETRTLNIYLPDNYQTDSTTAFPVFYLLDGSANEDFVHIVGIVQFMNMMQMMPPCIVVGIANVDRKRDFTFPTTNAEDKKRTPTSGGSEKFITFLEKELVPFVQKRYRTTGPRTLIGQSLGGLVASEILLKKSSIFDQYIIVSPSLWWDNQSLLNDAPGLFAKQPDNPLRVFVSVGTEGEVMETVAKKLHETLKNSGKKNLTLDFVPMPEENHATILHRCIYRIFEIMYPGKK